jgi:GTP-binding protein
LVLNKKELVQESDLPGVLADLENASGRNVSCISAAMGTNLNELLEDVWNELGV